MAVYQRTLAIAVAFTILDCSSAANIIILCLPWFSHMSGPVNVGKALQKQGHNVSVVIPRHLHNRLEGTGLRPLFYQSTLDFETKLEQAVIGELFYGQESWVQIGKKINDQMVNDILKNQQLLKDIQAQVPDLICIDSIARMLTIIPYKFDIPFLFIGSLTRLQYSRSPVMPSFIPGTFSDFTDQMSFAQKLFNTFDQLCNYVFDPFSNWTAVHDHAPEKPYIPLVELDPKALLWIIGLHNVLGYSPPTMPNVKHVGLLTSTKPKPLLQKFNDFVDSAKHGVVVVSLGSVLKSVPREIFDKLLAAFQKTKYKFVMRHSTTKSNSDQFLFTDWLPQFDLLHHKSTRLFITHCGANGMHEAVRAGIPILAFPAFADQPYNAGIVVRKGFGLKLDIRKFDVGDVVSAIEEVITNPKYKVQTEKASAIMRAERVPPVEEATFWINHVLTFGADHLRSSGQDIPLWQYLGLDVLAVCLVVWHFILFVFIKILRLSFRCFCGRKEKLKTN